MKSERITLWTRQVPEVLEELNASGVYTVKEEYIQKKNGDITSYYLDLYKWFTLEAKKYISIDDSLKYPVWLSVNQELMLQPVENSVILELEIPTSEILIINENAWDYRVNYWYVPIDNEDEQNHNFMLKNNGIANESEITMGNKGIYYPFIKNKIIKSWERVFTLPPKDNQEVATVWQLKKEWIKKVYC
ncbi:MAG: DUF3841 domain-containing protein [Suipraeoptans sp.]